MNKILEIYEYGFFSVSKLIMLLISITITLFISIITITLWWIKCIRDLLCNLGNVIERIINL